MASVRFMEPNSRFKFVRFIETEHIPSVGDIVTVEDPEVPDFQIVSVTNVFDDFYSIIVKTYQFVPMGQVFVY